MRIAPFLNPKVTVYDAITSGLTKVDSVLIIDIQANAAKGLNADGSTKEEWYNPFLECKQGLAFNGDTAPLVGTKTKYLATPGWPTKTMGVFECKWTIKRDPTVKLRVPS